MNCCNQCTQGRKPCPMPTACHLSDDIEEGYRTLAWAVFIFIVSAALAAAFVPVGLW